MGEARQPRITRISRAALCSAALLLRFCLSAINLPAIASLKNRRGRRKSDGINRTVRMIFANLVHSVRTSVSSVVKRIRRRLTQRSRRGRATWTGRQKAERAGANESNALQHSCSFVSFEVKDFQGAAKPISIGAPGFCAFTITALSGRTSMSLYVRLPSAVARGNS